MIAARRRFFGDANVDANTGAVDPSKAILSWFGVTNFAMAIGGAVVLLDAWVPRGMFSGRVPTSPAELAALAPSHIFIGHGHFDHAGDAAEIATLSGATIVGTRDHCTNIGKKVAGKLNTHVVGNRDNMTFGRGVTVQVVSHVHSTLRRPDGTLETIATLPDLTPTMEHPPTVDDVVDICQHLGDPEGGALLYQFRIGDFVLTWHDSSGPVKTDAPWVLDELRALPASTVQVGAVQGFNQYTNGMRDPIEYIRALRPKVFVPSHHDNWMPVISSAGSRWLDPIQKALAGVPNPPSLHMLEDPADYVNPKPLTFDISR